MAQGRPVTNPSTGRQEFRSSFSKLFREAGRIPSFQEKTQPGQIFSPSAKHQGRRRQSPCPQIGWVEMIQSREIDGAIKNATFKIDPLGHWFISFSLEVIVRQPLEIEVSDCTGVDLGLSNVITTDKEQKVSAPTFYRRGEKKIKKASRSLSRKKKGSSNRAKARTALAKVHAEVKNKRS